MVTRLPFRLIAVGEIRSDVRERVAARA